ncbi:hypothetical protein pb186bvf_015010 [Paramecium bursaria]
MVPFKFKFHDIQVALQLSANIFTFIRCMLKEDTDKFEQIKYGSQMINRQMDIIYIIKKLNEIDKMKAVIFSNQQIKLFDYHPKPTIPIKPFISKLPNAKYFHTHRQKQSQYANALEASRVFDQLCSSYQIKSTKRQYRYSSSGKSRQHPSRYDKITRKSQRKHRGL